LSSGSYYVTTFTLAGTFVANPANPDTSYNVPTGIGAKPNPHNHTYTSFDNGGSDKLSPFFLLFAKKLLIVPGVFISPNMSAELSGRYHFQDRSVRYRSSLGLASRVM
jgi:hypothetical protein